MEVARDLLDHQLKAADGERVGRVDEIGVILDDRPRLGPLRTGPGVVLDQLGPFGRLLTRAFTGTGATAALRRTAIDWSHVREVTGPALILYVPGSEVRRLPDADLAAGEHELAYSTFAALPVVDAEGRRLQVLDVRVSPHHAQEAPRLEGILAAPSGALASLGLKRSDESRIPFVRIAERVRYVPWEEVASVDGRIAVRRPFRALPLLGEVGPSPAPLPPKEAGP